jgi:hypothetical protein
MQRFIASSHGGLSGTFRRLRLRPKGEPRSGRYNASAQRRTSSLRQLWAFQNPCSSGGTSGRGNYGSKLAARRALAQSRREEREGKVRRFTDASDAVEHLKRLASH